MRILNSYNSAEKKLISDDDLKFANRVLANCPEAHFNRQHQKLLDSIATAIIANASQPKIDEVYEFFKFNGNPLAVTLGFFQQIDNPPMADRAQALLDGLDDRFDVVLAADKRSTGFVKTTDQKSTICINQNGTTEDIFTAIHEIAHPFDFDNKSADGSNPTRDTLGEVAPIALELIACDQLTKNGAITLSDAESKIAELRQATYYNAVETKFRLNLLDRAHRSWTGKIDHREFIDAIEQLKMEKNTIPLFLNRTANHIRTDYRPYRYMIARLLSPKIYQDFQVDPAKTMADLNNFQRAVSNNNLELALQSVGVEPDNLNLPRLASLFDNL